MKLRRKSISVVLLLAAALAAVLAVDLVERFVAPTAAWPLLSRLAAPRAAVVSTEEADQDSARDAGAGSTAGPVPR